MRKDDSTQYRGSRFMKVQCSQMFWKCRVSEHFVFTSYFLVTLYLSSLSCWVVLFVSRKKVNSVSIGGVQPAASVARTGFMSQTPCPHPLGDNQDQRPKIKWKKLENALIFIKKSKASPRQQKNSPRRTTSKECYQISQYLVNNSSSAKKYCHFCHFLTIGAF